MKIAKNAVATFHYTLSDEDGEELENSRTGAATAYLHGSNSIIKGLEAELEDKTAGDTLSVTLAPTDAYGLRRADRVQRVPVKHLLYKGKLRAGMAVQLNTSQGRQAVTVTKAGRHSADIDTNHPLAGKPLRFDIEVLDVREATADEVSHGHAHGVGGHQH